MLEINNLLLVSLVNPTKRKQKQNNSESLTEAYSKKYRHNN